MKLVEQTFNELFKARRIHDVNKILVDLPIEDKYQMKAEKYPTINFQITKNEIEKIVERGLLTESYQLKDVSGQDPLIRLLYSLIWKNGDLEKLRHIVEGIVSEKDDEKQSSLVFYQFGKYLTKRSGEPIIDQHVLRAFGIYKELENKDPDDQSIRRLIKLNQVTKKEKPLIQQYKDWLTKDLRQELRECENYVYHVDKVLFALGKKIKKEGLKGFNPK